MPVAARAGWGATPLVARVYGWLWLVLVPGVAALGVALIWAPVGSSLSAGSPLWTHWIARASPLTCAFELTRAETTLGAAFPGGLVTLGIGTVVWALTTSLARAGRPESNA